MHHNRLSGAQNPETTQESRLSPELQAYVRTPDFKAWFGDWENNPNEASKMVDENGEPRVVFSGLPAGIKQLAGDARVLTGSDEIGFYFTQRLGNARGMAEQRRDPVTDEVAPSSVYSAFLNIRHPYIVQQGDGVVTTRVTHQPEGVDGFINGRLQEIVVFDPNQVAIVAETPINIPDTQN